MASPELDEGGRAPSPPAGRLPPPSPHAPPRRFRGMGLLRYHYVPAAAVVAMLASGLLGPREFGDAAAVLWRPLLAIASIMVIAAAAQRLGVVARVAAGLFQLAGGSCQRLFVLVFGISLVSSAVLNNDAAVLLLVPVVVALVRVLYPSEPGLLAPFALAVFMAAGVAPLAVSNPMNMIVAEYVGLDFNSYALRMVPISLAGASLALLVLRWIFRRELAGAPSSMSAPSPGPWRPREIEGLIALLATFAAYPLIAYAGGPVYAVSATGAAVALLLCRRHGLGRPAAVIRHGVAWEVLVFLVGVSVMAVALRDLSAGALLAGFYQDTGLAGIGLVSAAGSALLNNHPMSLLNMLALDAGSQDGLRAVLAALIGGDLGPRLLPWGSLAGLLWFASLRRLGVRVPVGQFMAVGATLTAVALPVSLGLLLVLP